jgi:hypothetical protein
LEGQKTKLIAAFVILGVAGGMFYFWSGDDARDPRIEFVCVETGDVFTVRRSDVSRIPRENPSTGRRTLLPLIEEGETKMVAARWSRSLYEELSDVNEYVDPRTLEVRRD